MIEKTKDYGKFKFRNDNRAKIDKPHVKRLVDSIKSRNLLHMRPILVNEKMEVIDGQHRLKAAMELDVEIFYQIEKKLSASDIILVNIAQKWSSADYLNYYCQHEYPEYLKLKSFIENNELTLRVALNIVSGTEHDGFKFFREGKFCFDSDVVSEELAMCWDTINYIRKINGYSVYTQSAKFWKALLSLIRHPLFDASRWRENMQRMISHFAPKSTYKEYQEMFQNIYNWRTKARIDLIEK